MIQTEQTEQSVFIEIPSEKIYSEKAIWIGTLLAGPLVGGYMMAENFKVFNEQEKAKKAIIYSIIATIVVFGVAFSIPENIKAPTQVFPIIYAFIASYLVKQFQKENIKEHISNAGKYFSGWRATVIILIALLIAFAFAFCFAILIGY